MVIQVPPAHTEHSSEGNPISEGTPTSSTNTYRAVEVDIEFTSLGWNILVQTMQRPTVFHWTHGKQGGVSLKVEGGRGVKTFTQLSVFMLFHNLNPRGMRCK